MLQSTPKHHFGSNGGYWVCSCENVRWKFGTPKQCVTIPKRTSLSHRFACIQIAKCCKTLPNIILGLMEAIGCVRAKTFVGTSIPRNSALLYRNALCSCENVHRNFGTPKQCI